MKKLTCIQLSVAIFAVILINITTQVELPILNVFRPMKDLLSEYVGGKDGRQKIETAIDIYIKHKQINQQIPQEEANLVETLMRICQQKKTLFEMLGQANNCTPSDLKKVLILILESLNKKPVLG